MLTTDQLAEVYLMQRKDSVSGGVYHKTQCEFAYNSNHMEGSKLTEDQTRMIFEKSRIDGTASVDDILEAQNHFTAFDYILDNYKEPLTEGTLFELHRILKEGTRQAKNPLYAVGQYKKFENEVSGTITTAPAKVEEEIRKLLKTYESGKKGFETIIDFHVKFEAIHSFSDGNGRVGRLVMFKESLRHNSIPFIIADEKRSFYIRGLQNYSEEKGWLLDTCRDAQDDFIANTLPLAQSYYNAWQKTKL